MSVENRGSTLGVESIRCIDLDQASISQHLFVNCERKSTCAGPAARVMGLKNSVSAVVGCSEPPSKRTAFPDPAIRCVYGRRVAALHSGSV